MLVLTMSRANLHKYKIEGFFGNQSIFTLQVGNLAVGLCCRVGTSPGARREEEEVAMMLLIMMMIMMMVIAMNDD